MLPELYGKFGLRPSNQSQSRAPWHGTPVMGLIQDAVGALFRRPWAGPLLERAYSQRSLVLDLVGFSFQCQKKWIAWTQ